MVSFAPLVALRTEFAAPRLPAPARGRIISPAAPAKARLSLAPRLSSGSAPVSRRRIEYKTPLRPFFKRGAERSACSIAWQNCNRR